MWVRDEDGSIANVQGVEFITMKKARGYNPKTEPVCWYVAAFFPGDDRSHEGDEDAPLWLTGLHNREVVERVCAGFFKALEEGKPTFDVAAHLLAVYDS